MEYFNDLHNRRFWHQSEEARELLDEDQLCMLQGTIENVNNQLDFENDLSQVIIWSEYTIINRLMHWLSSLNDLKRYHNQSLSNILLAVIWAFKNQKPITKQTQHQCDISITIIKDILFQGIPIAKLEEAKFLLMNVFIISERPDLCIRSLHRQMLTYKKNTINVFKQGYDTLTNYLFVKVAVPSFLFPYLLDCSEEEYHIILKILEGKSLREILPQHLAITKTENALLQSNKIQFSELHTDILERFIVATRILKEMPKEVYILNVMLEASKIFKDQFESFKNDIFFWKSIFRFLVNNKVDIADDDRMAHFIDFFETKRYFTEQPLQYSLKGRTYISIERAMENWQTNELYSPVYLKYTWNPLPIEKWISKDDLFTYVIEEITNGKRLLEESKTMHHCVYSYANSCVNGNIHIFSLSKLRNNIKKSFVTIEVRNDKITQIAGAMNQRPTESALKIIKEWSIENGLVMAFAT